MILHRSPCLLNYSLTYDVLHHFPAHERVKEHNIDSSAVQYSNWPMHPVIEAESIVPSALAVPIQKKKMPTASPNYASPEWYTPIVSRHWAFSESNKTNSSIYQPETGGTWD